jgi:hypothetical protein
MVTRAQHQAKARSKPRIAPNNCLAPTAKVQNWFDDALRKDDPKPSRAACDRLAREFQIIVNRHNNAERARERPVPFGELKDVSLAEELNKRVRKVTAAAKQLMVAANELEDYAGGYQWTDKVPLSLDDVKDVLEQIILSPEASAALATQVLPAPPSHRRPHEAWHAAGREVAPLIQAAMRDAGYVRKKLRMADGESVTAVVGAAVINWAYGIRIKPAGFASAMKERSRSSETKKLKSLSDEESYNAQFPDAARIKIIS